MISTRKFGRTNIFLLGTPLHGNLGDSAIVLAESNFLHSLNKKFTELTFHDVFELYFRAFNMIVRKKDTLLFHGGGNMGNIWFAEEYNRRRLIKKHPDNRIIIFPQTIFYSDSKDGEKHKNESVAIYNRKNITLVAREKISYQIMKDIYPEANVLLVPDMVLSMAPIKFEQTRSGILLCMRRDFEKRISTADENRLINAISTLDIPVTYTDTVIDEYVTVVNRDSKVYLKLKEIASAKLVITDRLHGMIFSTITETPCIVLANNNHKVKGTYDWISYLDYVNYVETIDEAIALIPEMVKMNQCSFDNTKLQPFFDRLREELS